MLLIHGFRDYCAILFVKGALVDDPAGVLIRQTKDVQAARQIRFAGLAEIAKAESLLKDYVDRAIAVERAGLKVPMKETGAFAIPAEFQARLDGDPALRSAFQALTPGRQRGYLLHFAAAKQAKTREARIDRNAPRILVGKGLLDD